MKIRTGLAKRWVVLLTVFGGSAACAASSDGTGPNLGGASGVSGSGGGAGTSRGGASTTSCPPGMTDCSGNCVSLQDSGSHCGSCGTACPSGSTCVSGSCVCGAGQTACGGACTDVSRDPSNCGACGVQCRSAETCAEGVCGCLAGLTQCSGVCVDTNASATDCGACGVACGTGQVCSGGRCTTTCATGETPCNGACVDLTTSLTHCGACGLACGAGFTCSAGACVCPQGQTLCDGQCATTATDNANCGACGVACTGGQACIAGRCQCSTGRTWCANACVNTNTDRANCGTCGNACASGATCSGGTCVGGTGGTGGTGTTGGTGGTTGGTGGTTGGTGRQIGGVCWPLCASASSDPDGDGWGWENSASCVVVGSSPYNQGTPCGSGSGGSGGTGGASTGGTGGTTCSVAPANPNASTQARKLLCYLYQTYTHNVLSGQQETSWSNPQNDVNWYGTNVGKYPAILGGDYLYPSGTSTRAIAYWNAGGITMIRYHMGAPPLSDTYENSMGSTNIANVLTQGTQEYTSFVSKLDYIAGEIQKLEDANVALLWAPFHETQPNGWFWWSKGTATQFKQLWTFMFNYLTTTKGLNNIVWLMPFSGSPNGSWYPDKAYVDIAGPDTYATNQPFTSLFGSARNIIGTTVPIALHETGVVPQPSQMFPSNAPWLLWNIWAGYQSSNNSLSNIQSAYASSYTITRDEVPSLK